MSHLSKLTIKSVVKQDTFDPVIARRNKLLAAIEEQLAVVASTIRGEEYVVTLSRWAKNEHGEKVRVQRQRVTRPWFFAKDNGCQSAFNRDPLSARKRDPLVEMVGG